MLRPPLTVLETRLTATSFSLNSLDLVHRCAALHCVLPSFLEVQTAPRERRQPDAATRPV